MPNLDLSELDTAVARLKSSAGAFDEEYHRVERGNDKGAVARLDAALAGLEATLTDPDGLPGREWYKHMVYAPGLHTGYGVKTLPGIREAIEEGRWDEAKRYVGVVARALNHYSARLDQSVALR